MEPVDLDRIPDNKRGLIESWLTHCQEPNVDENEYAYFLDATTTREELSAFLSPFDRADDVVERLLQMNTMPTDPVDDSVLVVAARAHVAEMAHNALALGEDEMARIARSVSDYRIIDENDVPPGQQTVDANLRMAVSDAVGEAVFSSEGPAVVNLYMVLKEWLLDLDASSYVIQPLVSVEVELSAFGRLRSLGAGILVVDDVAYVFRFDRRGVAESTPPLITTDLSVKQAARSQIDWSRLPTARQDVAELVGDANSGDHPSLAKLSLMYMSGTGVEHDVPKAFGLLEQAAGDYSSVVDCYEAGFRNNVLGADYGLSYLYEKGWGVPRSEEVSVHYLMSAADGEFPRAMYVLGLKHKSGDSGVEQDLDAAEHWLTKAAASGMTEAYGQLYNLRKNGDLNERERAFGWLRRAAGEDGWSGYQFALGRAYENGEGTRRDVVRAAMWYYIAACQSAEDKPARLKDLGRLMPIMSEAEVDAARDQALAWIEENGDRSRRFELPDGVLRDPLALIER